MDDEFSRAMPLYSLGQSTTLGDDEMKLIGRHLFNGIAKLCVSHLLNNTVQQQTICIHYIQQGSPHVQQASALIHYVVPLRA